MSNIKKKSVILFNATGLTGIQKNNLTQAVAKQCRQDNYRVSRIFYYQDYCHHSVLYKLAEFVSRTREKATVIFANDTYESEASNSQIIYSVLSTLSIAGHIDLCLYKEQVTLQHVAEHELKLMQRAVSYGQPMSV